MGPILGVPSHSCLDHSRQEVTCHVVMGTLGLRRGLGEGQGISCLDASGMSKCSCPYSCPPVKHNFKGCLTTRGVGGKPKDALKIPGLSTLCHPLSIAPALEPGSTSTGHVGRAQPGSFGYLGPSWGSPGIVLRFCAPFFLSLFSLPLCSTKLSAINPRWSQAPSLPTASVGLGPGSQAELQLRRAKFLDGLLWC